ncbi:MAG TPA: STAS domain-containing protein [Gemmataceae bacterium]|jgi:anti-sigma B factor antagonist|nr:STAS domain-containing protein [Gemmataceae bacterium]
MNYIILDEADEYIHLRLATDGEPGMPGSFPDIASLLIARPHPKTIVIDMRGIQWIDSSNIGGLIGVHRKCLEMGRQLILHAVQPAVVEVLRFCKLDRFFTIKPGQKEALELAVGGVR